MKLKSVGRLLKDIVYAFKRDGKLRLLPICLVLLVLAAILVFITITGPLAPFIYPLF